jgi:hypothetical protein
MSLAEYNKIVTKCRELNINASINTLNSLIHRGITFDFLINNLECFCK